MATGYLVYDDILSRITYIPYLLQVCVATVSDVMYEYVLIHFDGWEEEFDYWVHHTSTLLHPVG